MEAHIFMPKDTRARTSSNANRPARSHVNGRIDNRLRRRSRRRKEAEGWFDVSTLKEPYRIEGKKTMVMSWPSSSTGSLPDVILYPTGAARD